jgi:hypothetical protein
MRARNGPRPVNYLGPLFIAVGGTEGGHATGDATKIAVQNLPRLAENAARQSMGRRGNGPVWKEDVMDRDIAEIDGQCHCGAVRFRVRLSDGLHTARRCTCSYCRMRGAVAVSADLGGVTILAGEDQLAVYQFNTKTAKHYFCARCGIYTHHQRRSNPNQYGVNVACLAGVSPFDFAEVPVNDGIHHPSDGAPSRIAGILKFEPAAD